ncbi:MAG: hypothetical protein JXP73_17910 [Deltaproteobacteria bacterium]|nr:hypothetical protein [Deltaproteobacteria bacterium]
MSTLRPAQCPGRRRAGVLVLLTTLGVACSLPFSGRSPAPAAPAPAPLPPKPEPSFPNQDLAAKHQAVKAAPQDFDTVMAYARTLSDFCQASLVDTTCGPACTSGPVRYKPASALDPNSRLLVEQALPMLDALMNVQGLSWERMGHWAAVKGRLLSLAGRAAEERALIDGYALQHSDAFPVVKRRLELLREAHDPKEAEAQCARSRASLRMARVAARLELLTTCVAYHPDNTEGITDPPDYAKYLPKLTRDERRLYRKYVVQRCGPDPAAEKMRCSRVCACDGQVADKKQCKRNCRNCLKETAERRRACRKSRR